MKRDYDIYDDQADRMGGMRVLVAQRFRADAQKIARLEELLASSRARVEQLIEERRGLIRNISDLAHYVGYDVVNSDDLPALIRKLKVNIEDRFEERRNDGA
jgi:hypothetical protein